MRSRVQWRSSTTGRGALSVMTTGASLMPALSAECWDLATPSLLIDCKHRIFLSDLMHAAVVRLQSSLWSGPRTYLSRQRTVHRA